MVLPFPAQGHVIPLMELSHRLVDYGFKIDFVNTEFNHDCILKSMQNRVIPEGIDMLSVPDGMDPADDHTDIGKLVGGLPAAMFSPIEEIIKIKKIKWVIADVSMSWALKLTNTVGVRIALFSTYSASVFALRMKLPKLIEDGVVDEIGNVKIHKMIQLAPPIDSTEIPWVSLGSNTERRRVNIQRVINTNQLMSLAEAIICNTSGEVEPEALALLPNALPIGPLVAPMSKLSGLKLCANEQGVVTKEEIKDKVVQLLKDEDIKARAIMWKNKACASVREGGSSHENLLKLVKLLQEG
ncbi:hypothetical protein HU200_029538 [Digitaria exilis]|uniref:UDP-glycosyltransferase n=1 Tax=Digitaria exilis TaxID=1010633 RepID=A0A835BTL6_9POAL|nr:hypothetical protein HU200_029538 [Digitaria exilis]